MQVTRLLAWMCRHQHERSYGAAAARTVLTQLSSITEGAPPTTATTHVPTCPLAGRMSQQPLPGRESAQGLRGRPSSCWRSPSGSIAGFAASATPTDEDGPRDQAAAPGGDSPGALHVRRPGGGGAPCAAPLWMEVCLITVAAPWLLCRSQWRSWWTLRWTWSRGGRCCREWRCCGRASVCLTAPSPPREWGSSQTGTKGPRVAAVATPLPTCKGHALPGMPPSSTQRPQPCTPFPFMPQAPCPRCSTLSTCVTPRDHRPPSSPTHVVHLPPPSQP
jgi:hypothetical protein